MITFFHNQDKGTYFLLDPVKKTLQHVGRDYNTFNYYRHLVPQQVINIPNYTTMQKFQKCLKTLDLSTVEGDLAQHLVDSYPEFFI